MESSLVQNKEEKCGRHRILKISISFGLVHVVFEKQKAALKVSADLNLLTYDICLILRRFERLLFDIIWRNKYDVVDGKGDEIDQLKLGHLVSIVSIKEAKFMLDDFLCLPLDG